MAKSEFEKWFETQFGKRPFSQSQEQGLKKDLSDTMWKLGKIEQDLRKSERWHADYRAARYAYNMATGGKAGK